MKKTVFLLTSFAAFAFTACKKSADASTSLVASTTQAVIGQAVAVTLNSSGSQSTWSVTPTANVVKTYTVTTAKVNTFTFSEAGTYTIGVKVSGSGCAKGQDTASVQVVVLK
jgi:streptogramin lyase